MSYFYISDFKTSLTLEIKTFSEIFLIQNFHEHYDSMEERTYSVFYFCFVAYKLLRIARNLRLAISLPDNKKYSGRLPG
jgi:hypothetical protein